VLKDQLGLLAPPDLSDLQACQVSRVALDHKDLLVVQVQPGRLAHPELPV